MNVYKMAKCQELSINLCLHNNIHHVMLLFVFSFIVFKSIFTFAHFFVINIFIFDSLVFFSIVIFNSTVVTLICIQYFIFVFIRWWINSVTAPATAALAASFRLLKSSSSLSSLSDKRWCLFFCCVDEGSLRFFVNIC